MVATVQNLTVLQDESFAIAVNPNTWIDGVALAANIAEAVDVPTGARFVVFGADVNFAVRYNATAAGTAAAYGDVTNGTGVEINPTIRFLTNVAEISIITNATGGGNVSLLFGK